MIKVYMFLAIVMVLGGTATGAVMYYKDSQARIAQLQENNAKLQSAAETLQNTVSTMQADAQRNASLNRELTQRLQAAEGSLDRLRGRLAEIDLTLEALNDPANLEARINRGVQRLINDLARETGRVEEVPADTANTTTSQ